MDFSPLLISMISLLFSQTVSDEDLFKGLVKVVFPRKPVSLYNCFFSQTVRDEDFEGW